MVKNWWISSGLQVSMDDWLRPSSYKVWRWHSKNNQQATCRHLDIFGTPWCWTATCPDCYEKQHCRVSLVILLIGVYPDYTRFAPSQLKLSSDGAIFWWRGRPQTYLNLLRLSGHLKPKYCVAPGSMSQRFYRSNILQTMLRFRTRIISLFCFHSLCTQLIRVAIE